MPRILPNTLSERLDMEEVRLAECSRQISDRVDKIQTLQWEIKTLEESQKTFANRVELLKELVSLEDSNGDGESLHSSGGPDLSPRNRSDAKKPSPSAAIISLLKTQGVPLTREFIIDSLENKVESKAANRRHVIRTCIAQLEKRGAIDIRDGKYVIFQ